MATVRASTLPRDTERSSLFLRSADGLSLEAHSTAGATVHPIRCEVSKGLVGDLAPVVQAKLLRFLQEGTYRVVGDPKKRRLDARVLAATNRPVAPGEEGSTMREDLFYRLGKLTLDVPPLRERSEDSVLIFVHLLRRKLGQEVRLSSEVRPRLLLYPWPGNVREVEAAAFLDGARAAFTNALGNEEVLSAMEPLGLSRQAIESLLSRVGVVEQAIRAHEGAKGFAKNAASEAGEEGRRFRRWFTPWRRQVRLALRPMPRLLERVKSAEQGQ